MNMLPLEITNLSRGSLFQNVILHPTQKNLGLQYILLDGNFQSHQVIHQVMSNMGSFCQFTFFFDTYDWISLMMKITKIWKVYKTKRKVLIWMTLNYLLLLGVKIERRRMKNPLCPKQHMEISKKNNRERWLDCKKWQGQPIGGKLQHIQWLSSSLIQLCLLILYFSLTDNQMWQVVVQKF